MSQRKDMSVKIKLKNVGPISEGDIDLRDLTVLVGPQASGKSIFLQTLKLAMDRRHILEFFKQHNVEFNGNPAAVLDGYYGRGMGGMLKGDPRVTWKGVNKRLESLTRFRISDENQAERLFYIPAQRVVSLPSGASQTFDHFNFGDPYVLRYFAHQVHILLQNEFGSLSTLFPAHQRLDAALKKSIEDTLLGGAELRLEQKDFTKTLALKIDDLSEGDEGGLPFLAWSAGQREFVPLLLGLYWLCPAGRGGSPEGKGATRDDIEWVVIEEPEMGLHPRAIATFLLLTLELLRRGYKVVLSTHSTVVLDLIWALRHIKDSGEEKDIRKLFALPATQAMKKIAKSAMSKDYRVYFFERGSPARNITSLDPDSEDETIYNWGDLNGFSGRAADIVAKVISRADLGAAKK